MFSGSGSGSIAHEKRPSRGARALLLAWLASYGIASAPGSALAAGFGLMSIIWPPTIIRMPDGP